MKKLIALLVIPALLLSGCFQSGFQLSNAQISAGVQIGTGAAFTYALKDNSKRPLIAKYVSAIAGVVRAATGKETPDELAKMLNDAVPPNVSGQVPEIGSIVIPLVVSTYQTAKAKYGSDYVQLYGVLNAVATGLENGAAPFTANTGFVTIRG